MSIGVRQELKREMLFFFKCFLGFHCVEANAKNLYSFLLEFRVRVPEAAGLAPYNLDSWLSDKNRPVRNRFLRLVRGRLPSRLDRWS